MLHARGTSKMKSHCLGARVFKRFYTFNVDPPRDTKIGKEIGSSSVSVVFESVLEHPRLLISMQNASGSLQVVCDDQSG